MTLQKFHVYSLSYARDFSMKLLHSEIKNKLSLFHSYGCRETPIVFPCQGTVLSKLLQCDNTQADITFFTPIRSVVNGIGKKKKCNTFVWVASAGCHKFQEDYFCHCILAYQVGVCHSVAWLQNISLLYFSTITCLIIFPCSSQ